MGNLFGHCQTLMIPVMAVTFLSACQPPDDTAPETRQSLFSDVQSSAGFAPVTAATPLRLPADHGPHPQYQLEWWYLTVLLQDRQQQEYGLQYTLFRLADSRSAQSDWGSSDMWMAHLSLHSAGKHWFKERFARGGVGNAGVTAGENFSLFLDDWNWQGSNGAPFPAVLLLPISDTEDIKLSLSPTGPYVRHGENGISAKSADGQLRSYYYSLPFIEATGTLQLNGEKRSVSGTGWYDHEWTSHLAREEALGWDWFSLHLDDGRKLMAFRMHVNEQAPFITGTLIQPDGTSTTLTEDDLALTPTGYESIAGKEMPVKWQLSLKDSALQLNIAPFKKGQWNAGTFGYYEGAVTVSGSHSGKGFMELTGYQN